MLLQHILYVHCGPSDALESLAENPPNTAIPHIAPLLSLFLSLRPHPDYLFMPFPLVLLLRAPRSHRPHCAAEVRSQFPA